MHFMDRKAIEQKRDKAEKKFVELQTQEADIQKELLRLQGEYRSYTAMLEEDEPTPKVDATTITATPKTTSKVEG